MELTAENLNTVNDEMPGGVSANGDGKPPDAAEPEETAEDIQAQVIADQQRQIDDLKRQVNRANAHIQPTVGKVPKRTEPDSVYDEDEGEEEQPAARQYANTEALAKELGQEFTAKYPELAKDETGRGIAQEVFRELSAAGKIGPDTDPWIALERVGTLGMERLKVAQERKSRLDKLEKVRTKSLVGAKGTGASAPEPTPEQEDEKYAEQRGPHQIPRA
jgi:hypothetical protein